MTMLVKRLTVLALVLAFAAWGTMAMAEEIPANVCTELLLFMDMPKVSIASAKDEDINQAPANVFVITGQEMKRRGYLSLDDLFKDLPGVYVNNVLGYTANVPIVRGLATDLSMAKYMKLMIDGITFDARNGNRTAYVARIPIEGVEKVEFIIGPYAALYGRNTFAGVMNVTTKSGKKISGTEMGFTYGQYNRNQQSLVAGKYYPDAGLDVYFSLFRDQLERLNLSDEYARYSLEQRRQNDPLGWFQNRLGENGVPQEHYLYWNNSDVYLKLEHASGLGADLEYNRVFYPEIGTNNPEMYYLSNEDSHVVGNMVNTRLRYQYDSPDKSLNFKSNLLYQYFDDYCRNIYLTDPLAMKWYGQKGNAVALENKATYRVNDLFNFYAGLMLEQVKSFPFTPTGMAAYVDKPSWNAGDEIISQFANLSFQGEVSFWKIRLVPGLMYEKANNHKDLLLPRFSAIGDINSGHALKYIYSTGFLSPDPYISADQLTGSSDDIKGRTDVKPERMESHEFQYLFTMKAGYQATVTVFKQFLTDLIEKVEYLHPPYDLTWDNVSKREVEGFEIRGDAVPLEFIKLFCAYSYTRGKFNDRDGLYGVPNAHMAAGIDSSFFEEMLNLYVHDLYVGRISNYETTYYDMPGYNVVDLNLTLKLDKIFKNKFELSLGLKNLFNTEGYDGPASGDYLFQFPTPIRKRTWTLTLRTAF